MSLHLPDVPTAAWWRIRPTGPTITAPPRTPGWFYWAWCFTWPPLLQVAEAHVDEHLTLFVLVTSVNTDSPVIKVKKTSSSCLVSLRDGSHALDHQLRDLSAVGQEHRKRLRCRSQLDVQHPGVADIPPPGSVFHLLRSVFSRREFKTALLRLCCCLASKPVTGWHPSLSSRFFTTAYLSGFYSDRKQVTFVGSPPSIYQVGCGSSLGLLILRRSSGSS